MMPNIRHCCLRLAVMMVVCFVAAPAAFPQVNGSVVSDLKERLSRTGVFFRADAPRSLRNSGDNNLPVFVEIINGVEQEAHTTGSSVSNRFKRGPLSFLGVNVFVKPTGARHQFTAEPLLLGSSKDFSFDAGVDGQPRPWPARLKKPFRFPLPPIHLFLPPTF